MITLEDGHAVNMGDTIVIQQVDNLGVAHSVVVTAADLEALAPYVKQGTLTASGA